MSPKITFPSYQHTSQSSETFLFPFLKIQLISSSYSIKLLQLMSYTSLLKDNALSKCLIIMEIFIWVWV